MTDDEVKGLEDRVTTWVTNTPLPIVELVYRQINRARDVRLSGIDARIRQGLTKLDIKPSCPCAGIHQQPWSHYIA